MELPPTTTAVDSPSLLLSPLKLSTKVTTELERRRRSCEIPELNLDDFRRRDEPASDFSRRVTTSKEQDANQEATRSESNSLLHRLALSAPVPCYFFKYGLCTKGDTCSFSHTTTTTTDHDVVKPPSPQSRHPVNNSPSAAPPPPESRSNDNNATLEASRSEGVNNAGGGGGDDQRQQRTGRGTDLAGDKNVGDGEVRKLRMLKERLLARPLSSSGGKGFDLREQLKRKAGDGNGCVVGSTEFQGPKSLAQIKEEKRRRAEEQKGKVN